MDRRRLSSRKKVAQWLERYHSKTPSPVPSDLDVEAEPKRPGKEPEPEPESAKALYDAVLCEAKGLEDAKLSKARVPAPNEPELPQLPRGKPPKPTKKQLLMARPGEYDGCGRPPRTPEEREKLRFPFQAEYDEAIRLGLMKPPGTTIYKKPLPPRSEWPCTSRQFLPPPYQLSESAQRAEAQAAAAGKEPDKWKITKDTKVEDMIGYSFPDEDIHFDSSRLSAPLTNFFQSSTKPLPIIPEPPYRAITAMKNAQFREAEEKKAAAEAAAKAAKAQGSSDEDNDFGYVAKYLEQMKKHIEQANLRKS